MMQYNSIKLWGNKLIQTNGMGKMREVWNVIDNDNYRKNKFYD